MYSKHSSHIFSRSTSENIYSCSLLAMHGLLCQRSTKPHSMTGFSYWSVLKDPVKALIAMSFLQNIKILFGLNHDLHILYIIIRTGSADICENQVPSLGKYNSQQYIKEMYMHERQTKMHFPQRKCPSHWFWIYGWHRVRSGLVWLCTSVATGPSDSTGQRWSTKGGRSEGGDERDPSFFHELIGLGRVYCRKQEEGRRERGRVKDEGWGWQQGACPIMWPSLTACLSSHCRNQFALCGTVDTERERLPGGLAQEKQQQTQPDEDTSPIANMKWNLNSASAATSDFLQYLHVLLQEGALIRDWVGAVSRQWTQSGEQWSAVESKHDEQKET